MKAWRVLVGVGLLVASLAGSDVAVSVDGPEVSGSSSSLPADSIGYDDAAAETPIVAVPARSALSVTCQAALPTREGQAMVWMAFPGGGTPPYSYAWSGWDGLGGTSQTVSKVYGTAGWKQAKVVATDQAGRHVSAECGMHVMPAAFSEPPTVNPVLWVPAGVDPAPMVEQLNRVWRSIRAGYYHLYGRTFRLNPLRVIVSDKTERELCGGDCTDQLKADTIVGVAFGDAREAVGYVPYTRAIQVMVWGGGAWAGSYGWDYTLGAVGDYGLTPAAGVQTPALEPDLADWLASNVGEYEGQISGAIAHELNHGIGWDDPHDFTLTTPPTDYEQAVVLAGPWMTETPTDTVAPEVAITSPTPGATISGAGVVSVAATDGQAMDAVVLLVDGRFWTADTLAPFLFTLDTRLLGFGKHQISALAYDAAGNTSKATVEATVVNIVAETSCSGDFPSGTFHACFYDGIGFDGPYLGTMVDHPFPVQSPNAGWGIRHEGVEEMAFGQTGTVSGVWRGTLDFPVGNYAFGLFADDGLRVWINGQQVVDAWQDQVAWFTVVVALDGPTPIEIQWYQGEGGQGVSMWWKPTRTGPPGQSTLSVFINGAGQGTVISDPAGIDCGLLCYHSYPTGTQVTLNAVPDAGWVFDGWSGACTGTGTCQLAMTETRTVTAAFSPGLSCRGVPATLVGSDGPDMLNGTLGRDVIVALGGDDTVAGLGGDDLICGGLGDDTIYGGGGRDRVFGDAGNDTLDGGDGNDRLWGGSGRDTLVPGSGADFLNGGGGVHDLVSYRGATAGVTMDLAAGIVTDGEADVVDDVEDADGSRFADLIRGSEMQNRLRGLDGNDALEGLDRNDRLVGGLGKDTADGGAGTDTCLAETRLFCEL